MTNRLLYNICVIFIVIFNIKESYSLKTNQIINSIKNKTQTYVDVSSLLDSDDKNASNVDLKYRHNFPECSTQQVCNALFVRMNHSQHLCECPSNFNWECNSNSNTDDGHTIELTRRYDKKVYTQVKLCEPLISVRTCKTPTDWTLLALQSERSGKAHYVVVCRCPDSAQFEGPYTHNYPPYARVPGIRVYGMLCNQEGRKGRTKSIDERAQEEEYPEFPWDLAYAVINSTAIQGMWK
jgi:hypothetical protein